MFRTLRKINFDVFWNKTKIIEKVNPVIFFFVMFIGDLLSKKASGDILFVNDVYNSFSLSVNARQRLISYIVA